MLLLEECGELARACRKHTSIKSDIERDEKELLDHELADVLMLTLDIANKFGINLEKAFREKEEINKKRAFK